MSTSKKCSTCGRLHTSQTTDRQVKGAREYWCSKCRTCSVAYTKEWRQANPQKQLLAGCKSRAKRFGLPFDLTLEDVVIPETCPALGIPLFHTPWKRTNNSPTVDRIDGTRGYVRGNVAVISWRANRLKNDATPEETLAIAAYVRRHQ